MSDTHNQQILRALRKGEKLTPLDALRRFGTLRLGARIFDLRREGWNVLTEMVENPRTGSRYAEYRLARKRKAAA